MTTSRDIGRILDHWLSDGPTAAPDRMLDVLADRIGGQSQRPGWRLDRRLPAMNPYAKALTAIAAVVLIAVIGYNLLPAGQGIGVPGPTPSPTPTPTATPTPIVIGSPAESLAPGSYRYLANGGGTTFTVPDGWSIPTLGGLDFSLAPVDAATDDTIRVFYDMRIASKDAACPETQEPGVGATAADIVGDIVANPGIDASTPEPITIGGLDGLVVDLALAEDWTGTCPFTQGIPTVAYIVDTVPSEGPFWGIGGDDRQRLIVLDHPDVTNVVFLIESADGSTFDALVEAAMPVLQTFSFE